MEHKPNEGKYDLKIKKANYDRDNGRFECRMKEGGTGNELHSKRIDLTVLLTPSEPTISPSDPIATEGRQMNLTCQSIGGSPPPEILWYTKEQSQALEANLIEGQNKDEPTQSVLTIIPRKEDDGSAYRCTVYNRALGAKKKLETSTKIFVNCEFSGHTFWVYPVFSFFFFFYVLLDLSFIAEQTVFSQNLVLSKAIKCCQVDLLEIAILFLDYIFNGFRPWYCKILYKHVFAFLFNLWKMFGAHDI